MFTAVIETAMTGAYLTLKDQNQVAISLYDVTDFLRSYQRGRLGIVEEPLQRGKSQQSWQVVVMPEDGKTIAHVQFRHQHVTEKV